MKVLSAPYRVWVYLEHRQLKKLGEGKQNATVKKGMMGKRLPCGFQVEEPLSITTQNQNF